MFLRAWRCAVRGGSSIDDAGEVTRTVTAQRERAFHEKVEQRRAKEAAELEAAI